jgi:hypothetical protein
MTLDEFIQSVQNDEEPSASLPEVVKALWWARKGDWDKAHHIAQAVFSDQGSWVHAHLHRVEGDLANARFWYRRAEKPECTSALDTEWREISECLLSEQ